MQELFFFAGILIPFLVAHRKHIWIRSSFLHWIFVGWFLTVCQSWHKDVTTLHFGGLYPDQLEGISNEISINIHKYGPMSAYPILYLALLGGAVPVKNDVFYHVSMVKKGHLISQLLEVKLTPTCIIISPLKRIQDGCILRMFGEFYCRLLLDQVPTLLTVGRVGHWHYGCVWKWGIPATMAIFSKDMI